MFTFHALDGDRCGWLNTPHTSASTGLQHEWALSNLATALKVGYQLRPNLNALRAFALAASASRFLGGEKLTILISNSRAASLTASTASSNAAWFACGGFVYPLTFLTNCNAAARTSSSVAGGSKLNNGRMLRHMTSWSMAPARLSTHDAEGAPRSRRQINDRAQTSPTCTARSVGGCPTLWRP